MKTVNFFEHFENEMRKQRRSVLCESLGTLCFLENMLAGKDIGRADNGVVPARQDF